MTIPHYPARKHPHTQESIPKSGSNRFLFWNYSYTGITTDYSTLKPDDEILITLPNDTTVLLHINNIVKIPQTNTGKFISKFNNCYRLNSNELKIINPPTVNEEHNGHFTNILDNQ